MSNYVAYFISFDIFDGAFRILLKIMYRRYLSVRTLNRISFIASIKQNFPKYITVKLKKLGYNHTKAENKRVFLSPKNITFVNFIHKRNCSDTAAKDSYHRHKYNKKIEKLINSQINTEFNAGYTYLNIATYYERSDVALPGCYGYFMKMYYEEQEHGLAFLKYQNFRGGLVCLEDIQKATVSEWPDLKKTFSCALQMEKNVKEELTKLYEVANECDDTNVQDMLDPFIAQQEQSICELARLVTRITFLGTNHLAQYFFDRELHETYVKSGSAKCTAEIGNKLYT